MLALLVMAQFHGLPADEARLRHEYGGAAFDVTMLLHILFTKIIKLYKPEIYKSEAV
ncbi:MAG: hypothetical protein ACFNZS_12580 [Ottowia sp.]